MTDLRLRSVSIRNWMTIGKADIEFPEKGLVLVSGSNLASKGKLMSVGSGKTALGEALCRSILGVKGRYKGLGLYSPTQGGGLHVSTAMDLKGKPLTVDIGYKSKKLSSTGEGISYTYDGGEVISRGKPQETRDEITSMIGVTPELAAWTVFLDGANLNFSDQSERNAVELLMAALRQPSWSHYQAVAKESMNEAKCKTSAAKSTYESVQREILQAQERLKSVTIDLEQEEERVKEEEKTFASKVSVLQQKISTEESRIAELADRQKAIRKELKELEAGFADAFADAEKEKATFSTRISKLRIKVSELSEDRSAIKSDIRVVERVLTEIRSEPEKCPRCAKPWDKKHGEDEEIDAKSKMSKLSEKLEAKSKEISGVNLEITEAESEIDAINSKIRSMKSPERNSILSREYENNDEAINKRKSCVTNLKLDLQTAEKGPDRTRLRRLQAVKSEREKAEKEAKDALEDAAQGLAESEAFAKVTGYWYEAFGPTGIPNMILQEALAPLNETARRVSAALTGGLISIGYSTSRELQTGESSSELVISVKNSTGTCRIDGVSKGELGLANLIVAETLAEVGSISKKVGFRWYDEVLNSQDSVVRHSVLSYLKATANDLGILVFIVDHHPETANYADHVLVAEKGDDSVTKFYWD